MKTSQQSETTMTTGTDIVIKGTGELATIRKVRKNGDLVARRWNGSIVTCHPGDVELLVFTAPKELR